MNNTAIIKLDTRINMLCDLADALESLNINVSKLDTKINSLRRTKKKLVFFINAAAKI